ncbi:MAG: serine/threonine-protein kinase [Myxococcaceae bacterium]
MGERVPLGSSTEEPSFRRVKMGEVLEGKWRIERKLGEGGMGTVWLALDLQLDRNVAVKILSPQLAEDAELVTRFEREARMTAALEHPNIVPVYAVGHLETRPFIVMKNLEGQTLASLIREKGNLKKDDVLPLLKQLASGLDFIHKRGFIHRDIKSGNIFVSPDGLATILDFGILRSKQGNDALTRTGIVMGTPQYMAPEQALGSKNVDHRVDLYALAVVLYEALTGSLPFDGDSDLSIVQMQAHKQPQDPCARAPWLPRLVGDVVNKALAKSPEDRFQTAEALFRALEDAFAGKQIVGPMPPAVPLREVQAKTDGEDDALAREVKKGRGLRIVAGIAAAVLAVGGGVAVALWPGRSGESTNVPVDAGGELAVVPIQDAGLELLTNIDAIDAGSDDVVEEEAPDAGGALAVIDLATDAPDAGAKVTKRPVGKGTGRVNVVSTYRGEPYWASVIVNGKKVGNTPVTLSLPTGRHVIRIERAGFRSIERRIMVASGRSDVLRIALTP